jgi:hypothetical protein
MNRFNLINNVLGWITFVVALITYTLTLEQTVSFWDCGEFISASYRLQICHPPGAPLFLIIGRLFSLLAGNDVTQVAYWVNMVSAVASAGCVMFYFWTITHLAKKLLVKNGEEMTTGQLISVLCSGLTGALALTWSDTFWFSAVEAEVYASSSFFTALTFWCILKWENVASEKHADRWIILIAYLIGLAIGVHLLNLLVIPAIVYVYYFKKSPFTRMGFIKASGVAITAIAVVQFGIIPGLPSLMAKYDYFFVNNLGMGFNTGVYATLIFIGGFLASAIHYTISKSNISLYLSIAFYALIALGSLVINATLGTFVIIAVVTALIYYFVFYEKASMVYVNTALLAVSFTIIGYSSYSMIMIRSSANTPIDMNDPEHPFSLLSYLNREQYGENPLVYGQYFYAKVVDIEKGPMQYKKGENNYEEVGPKLDRVYDPKDCTILPRMWADRPDYVQAYRQWEGIKEGKKATFGKNLHFMFDYQLGFMWARYFMWNFVGRQNDDQGFGDLTRGNWLSGINFIDKMRLGPQDNLPEPIQNAKARNTYFFLPLLLGLFGLFYHFKRAKEDAIVILTLFLFTGAFIVLYLNFPAHQPRERDYAYVGSFQTFMIWIGLGVLAVIDFLQKRINKQAAVGIGAVATMGIPVLMCQQNWNDHDRSLRSTALDFAYDYLNSCDKNAVLFTNGDNDTYPLWYAQNVAGIRTDIRVINLSLLNTDWYADALKKKVYDSEPVPFSLTPPQYTQGVRDIVYFYQNAEVEKNYGINQTDYYPLKNIMAFIADDKDPMAKLESQDGQRFSYYPTKRFCIPIDKEHVLKTGAVHPTDAAVIADSMKWEISQNSLMKADLITLDVLATSNWNRPVYFAITTGSDVYLNMVDYFQLEGLTYHIVPIKNTDPSDGGGSYGRINTTILYDNLMNKFKWGNMDKPGVYLDETILRQTKNFRNIFYRLAMKLVTEGKKDSAIKALDKCVAVMPNENVPYDVFTIRLCEAYYAAGANTKAAKLLSDVMDIYGVRYKYYSRFKGTSKAGSMQPEIEESQQLMAYCQQVAQFNKQDETAKALQAKMDTYLKP